MSLFLWILSGPLATFWMWWLLGREIKLVTPGMLAMTLCGCAMGFIALGFAIVITVAILGDDEELRDRLSFRNPLFKEPK